MYRRPQQSWKMPGRLKFNSVVLMALAALFVFTIYNLARLRVPPFGLDPCDAVMHFAIFTMVLALAGSLRALRLYRAAPATDAQNSYIFRSQHAVASSASIAFLAYGVVLARHPSMWIGAGWRTQLFEWLGVLAILVIAMESVVLAGRSTHRDVPSASRTRAVVVCILGITSLVFCPEYGAGPTSETAHILTVIIGALIVLVPVHYLLPALVPNEPGEEVSGQAFFTKSTEQGALLIGIVTGVFLFWSDAHRAAARPLLPILRLAGPLMGLLIVYAFLAEQLGLTPQRRRT
jgi:hypothetical protein